MFDRPILIYSDYCIHSKNLLGILMKYPDIYNSFIRINIDIDPKSKQRPSIFYKIQQQINQKIQKVPSLIITEEDKVFVLIDKDAFKWLDSVTKPKETQGYTGFNFNEMGSFSDGYSKFGSTDLNDATEQNFKFYQTDQKGRKILQGEHFDVHGEGQDMFLEPELEHDQKTMQAKYNNLENERQETQSNQRQHKQSFNQIHTNNEKKVNSSDFNNRLNSYKHETSKFINNRENVSGNSRQQIDFTNPNFGLSAKLGDNQKSSSKQQELDKKLEQLLLDRQS
jgi:hypothetical protein